MSKNVLYKLVRTYNLLLVIIPSIAFYRASVQPDYKWGLLAIHGKGISPEYWYLLSFMVLAWLSFALEIWYKRRWYYFLPIFLFSIVATVLIYGYTYGNNMVFQGDVWKFKFELGFLFVLLSLFLLIMAVLWAVKDVKHFQKSTLLLSGKEKIKLLSALSLSFIILLLFNQGKGGVHTLTDGIAVGLTVIQALFLANIIEQTGDSKQMEKIS